MNDEEKEEEEDVGLGGCGWGSKVCGKGIQPLGRANYTQRGEG